MIEMNSEPLVSVIMGIFNCEETLSEALDSVINQTYQNWELIMCDDGSTDGTYLIAEQYTQMHNGRIRLFRNDENKGLNYTLNRCLKEAKGDLIARMDGDDTCSPDRFQKEVDFLFRHPDLAIVSTDMDFFDDNGKWGKTTVKDFPESKDFINATPFCHAACMVRREAYERVDGYSVDTKLLRVEDYHLWIKMYEKGFKGGNIKEALYQMRDDRNAIKRKKFLYRLNEAYVKGYAIKHLGLSKLQYISCIKPILIGLLPNSLYTFLHHRKAEKK